MSPAQSQIRPGNLVEIRTPHEILQTLDADGTLNRLPFMPEMVDLCGKRFRVAHRALKTCYYGESNGMRKFPVDDVLILEGVRCSGLDHDGCQKACMIFWREAWLQSVGSDQASASRDVEQRGKDELLRRLKTTQGQGKYFCQASEILNATADLSRWDRISNCFAEVRAGNVGAAEMIGRVASWLFWRIRRVLFGAYARGTNTRTPVASLQLQPGEWVDVKSIGNISETLDPNAHNRGLYFTPDMRQVCGKRCQVERPLERIIVDGTGQMRKMHNTVYLKGGMCGCIYALGGCPRGEYSYWREIWLERADRSVDAKRRGQDESVADPALTR